MIKKLLSSILSDRSFVRLFYHNLKSYFYAFKYGFPTKDMYVIAVTGTNGKTSTCNLLYQAYKNLGVKVSMLSTVNYSICGEEFLNKNKMSTLPAVKLFKILKKMQSAGTEVLIIEATSHAAVQGRLNGIEFDQLVFTNLGRDHLEYHGGFDAYKKAKISLTKKLKSNSDFIYNSFDDHALDFTRKLKSNLHSFGYEKNDDLQLTNYQLSLRDTKFTLKFNSKKYLLESKTLGLFNIFNIMAVLISLDIYNKSFESNLDIVSTLKPVLGRLDVVKSENNTFIFDYAHDTSSLQNLLTFVSEQKKGDLVLLFGCVGGGRDKSKRPLMGRVAARFADRIFLTNDDPYLEDPRQIISQIKKGIHKTKLSKITEIIDRKQAIEQAFASLKPNDVLVLAGKGGEKVTVIGDQIIDFDEKQIVIDLIHKHDK